MTRLEDLVDGSRATLRFPREGRAFGARALSELGLSALPAVRDGHRVGALLTNDAGSVATVLACIRAGVPLVSLPGPGRGAEIDVYLDRLHAACVGAGVDTIVVSPAVAKLLVSAGWVGHIHVPHLGEAAAPVAVNGPGFELVQFSSGATSAPHPIVVSAHALVTNIEGVIGRLGVHDDDVSSTWLPLSHDMGLVGMLLGSIAACQPHAMPPSTLTILPPEDFLRAPARWLSHLADDRVTITACPDFALRYLMRASGAPASLARLRAIIVGGEPVRADTLATFATRFATNGLRTEALCPAYGMAEVGVGISMSPPTTAWRTCDVPHPLAPGAPPVPTVSCGPPLDGVAVRVADDTEPGELLVQTASIGADLAGRPLHDDGWFPTRDRGAIVDGEIMVFGRIDDVIVTAGRKLDARMVEERTLHVAGVRAGRSCCVGGRDGRWYVAFELDHSTARAPRTVVRDIRREVVRATNQSPDVIAVVAPGALPMTSSGKLQRREVAARLETGRLELVLVEGEIPVLEGKSC